MSTYATPRQLTAPSRGPGLTIAPEPSRAESRSHVASGSHAASRAFAVTALLGILCVAPIVLVVARLLESWRVSSPAGTHELSLLGAHLSYPSANAAAIVVLALAAFGLTMIAKAAARLTRELIAGRRLLRVLDSRSPTLIDGAWLFQAESPQAFCAGFLNPRVFVSTGAFTALEAPALSAVLAHERHHALRRDPLRLMAGRVLASGLFFLPAAARLVERHGALAEISADEAALLAADGDRSALASAMLGFSEAGDADGPGIDPERVDCLLGQSAEWEVPVALCATVLLASSCCIALAVAVARAASGSVTLALPFLSAQPCVLVLALLPALGALAGGVRLHSRRRLGVSESLLSPS